MLTELARDHLAVYRAAASDEMRARIRAIAIDCLLRAYDEGANLHHYLDMEKFQFNQLDV